jgi:hypothetical protein
MTKPTLLPGGCFYQRGVDSQRFCWPRVFFGCCILAIVFAATPARGADVRLYTVTRGMRFAQTNNGTPVFLPLNEYLFQASVSSIESNVIRSAMVEATTNRIDRILEPQSPTEWEFDDNENDNRDLKAKYPDGRYRYYIRTLNDGYRTNLSLMLTGKYPTVPQILNYNELQSASGTGFVQVTWAPFVGGTARDSIRLRIEELSGARAFSTRDFGEPGALDGRATNVVIEPGDLLPNETYLAWLEFRKTSAINTNSYRGATGWAYLHRRTEFRIRTSAAGPPDAQSYEVSKGHTFLQISNAAPVPDGTNAFQFSAQVQGQDSNSLVSGTVTIPGGALLNLNPEPGNELAFLASSSSPIDSTYPEGTYTFNIETQTNDLTLPLNLSPQSYPPAPRIRNFDPSQLIRLEGPLTLEWEPWADGRAGDFIQLRIQNNGTNVFETGDFGDNDALNGFATSVVIPTNVFAQGGTYSARLTFQRFTDLTTSAYLGSLGTASYFARTKFDINLLQDVQSYELAKGRHYIQTNALAVVPDGTNAFEFFAVAEAQTPVSILTASLKWTNSQVPLLAASNDTEFAHSALSANSLDSVYPDGPYTFIVETLNDGTNIVTLDLAPASYPPAPRFLHDPAVRVRHDQTNIITWEAWNGGGPNDFVQLRIRNAGTNVWETPDFGEEGALNGTATSAAIPPNVLAGGETYSARLAFRRFTDTNTTSDPDATALAYYFAETQFDLVVLLDVPEFELAKGQNYVQTNLSNVVPDGTNAFEFFAVAEAQTPASVLSASLRLPGGSIVPLLTESNGTEYAHSALSSNSLDSVYPDGSYTFDVQTLIDGNRQVSLNLAPPSYPPAPRFLHDPAVRVPHDQTNVITWEAWNGGGTNDFVQLRIRNAGTNVWETPDFGEPGALNGTATNAAIPANVLSRAETYSARLAFRRFTDTNTTAYPGSTALAYYFAETQFDLRTIAPDVEDYEIAKGRNYLQGETNISPEAGFEFQFNARVQGSITGLITSATLSWPGVTDLVLTADPTYEEFTYEEFAASESTFEERFPIGSYQFVVPTSNDGTQFLSLTLTNPIYPPAPQIRNYRFEPAEIRPGPAVPLEWDPWIGGTTNDFIQVQIRDAGTNVFETPDFGDVGALNGLSTNMVIPENLLKPGKNYGVRVTFRRFETINEGPPGTVGTLSYFARTKFNIFTLRPDAESYSLFKGREYTQTNSGAPVVAGYILAAVVVGNNQITNPHVVRLTPPNRSPVPLVDNGAKVFELTESFATEEELNAAYPDGPYVLEVTGTNYGTTNVTLYLTNALYPNPPHIANYQAAGSINASDDFFLQWDPFQDGTVEDYIGVGYLGIAVDSAYFSPAPGTMGALHGLHTSFAAQRGDLQANSLYNANVFFEKVLVNDETTYTEVPGRVGFYSRTSFRAVTQGQGNPPTLPSATGPIPMNRIEFLPGNQVQFPIGTVPGAAYLIEGSTNLVHWTVLNSFTADSSLATVVSQAPPSRAFFIRASLLRNQ